MLFVTTYQTKPHMTTDEVKELMEAFAEAGDAPGLVAHYVNTDGGGGIVITDSDESRRATATRSTTRDGWSSTPR